MRSVLLIASALGAGLALGRKYLERGVTTQKHKAIEMAAVETRRQIKRHASDFLKDSFQRFALTTGVKLLILGVLWILVHTGLIQQSFFVTFVAFVLFLFLLRDMWVSWPFVRLGFTELSRYGWRPRLALSEVVAAHVFQQVLTETSDIPISRTSRVALMLAGHNREGLQLEIATAVAAIARDTTWQDLRPYLVSAGLKMGTLFVIYSVSVVAILA